MTNGLILNSVDGSSWDAIETSSNNSLKSIANNGNIFVASINTSHSVITSTNMVTWDTVNIEGTFYFNKIKYLNNQFIAIGKKITIDINTLEETLTGGAIYTSTDGITWIDKSLTNVLDIFDIIFDGTNYIIVGSDYTNPFIFKSADLTTWESVSTTITDVYLTSICYNGLITTIGTENTIYYTTDYVTYTATSLTSTQIYFIKYYYNKFWCGTNTGKLLNSVDGITFTEIPLGISGTFDEIHITNLTIDNTIYILCGYKTLGGVISSLIITSTDGENWVENATNYSTKLFGIDNKKISAKTLKITPTPADSSVIISDGNYTKTNIGETTVSFLGNKNISYVVSHVNYTPTSEAIFLTTDTELNIELII